MGNLRTLKAQPFAILVTCWLLTWIAFGDIALVSTSLEDTRIKTAQIAALDIGSPWRYRVLSNWLLAPFTANNDIFHFATLTLHGVLFAIMYALLWKWLRQHVTADRALIGCVLTAAFFPLFLKHFQGFAWSTLEVILVLAALLLMPRWSRLPH